MKYRPPPGKLIDRFSFISLVIGLAIASVVFSLHAANWLATEAVYFLAHAMEQAPQRQNSFEVVVVMPTPTPRPATPVLGTPDCQIGMICAVPTREPQDCREVFQGTCTYRGFSGKTETLAPTPVPVPLPDH